VWGAAPFYRTASPRAAVDALLLQHTRCGQAGPPGLRAWGLGEYDTSKGVNSIPRHTSKGGRGQRRPGPGVGYGTMEQPCRTMGRWDFHRPVAVRGYDQVPVREGPGKLNGYGRVGCDGMLRQNQPSALGKLAHPHLSAPRQLHQHALPSIDSSPWNVRSHGVGIHQYDRPHGEWGTTAPTDP
jgi:hypothetical protein